MISGEAPRGREGADGATPCAGSARRVREVYIDERHARLHRRPRRRDARARGASGSPTSAPLIAFGASPRATLAFSEAARAVAFLHGRGYVTPEDVKAIASDVLRHRVLLTYEAEAENVTSRHGGRPRSSSASRSPEAPMLDRETLPQDPAHPDPHPRDPRVRDRRRLPLRVQGPRDGVRRGARVRARRRRAHDRLERHRAHGRALRQAVRRGARPHGAAGGRRVRLAALRLAATC